MEHNNKNEHNYELENDLNANQPINQPNNQTSNQSGNQSGNKTSSPPLPLFKKDNAVKRILFQIKKEISLLKTDKINLFIAIVLPPLIIILFAAMVINANPPAPVRVAVVDYDSNTYLNPQDLIETNYSNLSVDYIAILNSSTNHSLDMTLSHYYNGSENYNAMMEARALLREKMIDVIVVIPADFTELVQAGMPAIVDIIPDTSDVLNVQRYMTLYLKV